MGPRLFAVPPRKGKGTEAVLLRIPTNSPGFRCRGLVGGGGTAVSALGTCCHPVAAAGRAGARLRGSRAGRTRVGERLGAHGNACARGSSRVPSSLRGVIWSHKSLLGALHALAHPRGAHSLGSLRLHPLTTSKLGKNGALSGFDADGEGVRARFNQILHTTERNVPSFLLINP